MTRITHVEMVKKLVKPGQDIIDSLTPEKAHALHMAVGVSGEIGELVENFMDPDGTRENLIEELGDIEFYHHALTLEAGLNAVATSLVFPVPNDPTETLLHLVVEGSALLDCVKKWVMYNKACDHDELVLRLMNVRACLNAVYMFTGVTREQALEANIEKLYEGKKARYKRGEYTDEQAAARQDKE